MAMIMCGGVVFVYLTTMIKGFAMVIVLYGYNNRYGVMSNEGDVQQGCVSMEITGEDTTCTTSTDCCQYQQHSGDVRFYCWFT